MELPYPRQAQSALIPKVKTVLQLDKRSYCKVEPDRLSRIAICA